MTIEKPIYDETVSASEYDPRYISPEEFEKLKLELKVGPMVLKNAKVEKDRVAFLTPAVHEYMLLKYGRYLENSKDEEDPLSYEEYVEQYFDVKLKKGGKV
jgi:hypothetical protein|tara:strand:- start:1392 stop:1694 length:303 start_codon:yes stop_codon:yes gene_type:complete